MAQSFVTDNGVLLIPGSYSTIKVESAAGGLSTTGILMFIGESEKGLDFTKEADLSLNMYGPDQAADVTAKYGSGPLVDAFRAAIAPANDPNISGTFFRALIVKTNTSLKAAGLLSKIGGGTYTGIQDKTVGKAGNLISFAVSAKQAEVVPVTPAFTLATAQASYNINIRNNGGAVGLAAISAGNRPAAIATAIASVPGIVTTGGQAVPLAVAPAGKSLSLTVLSGNDVRIDITGGVFDNGLVAGSTVYIHTGSVISGVTDENAGSYVVTGASFVQIFATKVLDATGAGSVLTPPVSDLGGVIVSDFADCAAFSPFSFGLNPALAAIDGVGKSLEFADDAGVNKLSNSVFFLNASTGAIGVPSFVSRNGLPANILSAKEYIPTLTAARNSDDALEKLSAGGAVVLSMGYVGDTAVATVDKAAKTLSIVTTGGATPGTLPVIALGDYPTLSDLVIHLNTIPGFSASALNPTVAQQASTTLDTAVVSFGSNWGSKNGRFKQDGYKFFTFVRDNGSLIELSAEAASGVPATSAIAFLAGGAKGATTQATITAAIDALESVQGNFVIPLFSQDASADKALGLTDTGSDYEIDAINAYCRTHVLKMSTFKRKRNRQGFLSKEAAFEEQKLAASNISAARCAMAFQDFKDSNSVGNIVQYQPWMGAVKAAAMQAAGFYRPIVHKFINCSGVIQKAGDFSDQNDTNLEDALLAGLCPAKRSETGGFFWVSDQTTYTKDDNFVFNSIQAIYVVDIVALTTGKRMESAFVGQSIADVSAQLALSTLESIMSDMFRLKLIAASDDAPKGFRNAQIRIKGPVMQVSLEIKLAGAIYFVPISFLVSQVSQSAG